MCIFSNTKIKLPTGQRAGLRGDLGGENGDAIASGRATLLGASPLTVDPLTLAGKRIGQMIYPTVGDMEMAPAGDGSVKIDAPFPTNDPAGVRALEKATGQRLGTGPGGLFVAPGFKYGYQGPAGETMDPARYTPYEAPKTPFGAVWDPNKAAPTGAGNWNVAPTRVNDWAVDTAQRRGINIDLRSSGTRVAEYLKDHPGARFIPSDVAGNSEQDQILADIRARGRSSAYAPGPSGEGYDYTPDFYAAMNAWDQAYREWMKNPQGRSPTFTTGPLSLWFKTRVFDPYYERLMINRALDSPNEAGNAWYQGRLVGTRSPQAALAEIGKATDIAGTVQFLRDTFGPELLAAYDLPGGKEGGYMRQIGEAIVKGFGTGWQGSIHESPAARALRQAGFDPEGIALLTGRLGRDIDPSTAADYWRAFDEVQRRPGETQDQYVARANDRSVGIGNAAGLGTWQDRYGRLRDVLRGWRTVENVPGAGPTISERIADPLNAPETARVSRIPEPPAGGRSADVKRWRAAWAAQQRFDQGWSTMSEAARAEAIAGGYVPEGAADRFVQREAHAPVLPTTGELLQQWWASGADPNALPPELQGLGTNYLHQRPAWMEPVYGEGYAARPEQGGSPAFLNPDGTSKNIAYGTSPVSELLDRMNATGKDPRQIGASYRPLQEAWDRYTSGGMTEEEMDAFDARIYDLLTGAAPLLDPTWNNQMPSVVSPTPPGPTGPVITPRGPPVTTFPTRTGPVVDQPTAPPLAALSPLIPESGGLIGPTPLSAIDSPTDQVYLGGPLLEGNGVYPVGGSPLISAPPPAPPKSLQIPGIYQMNPPIQSLAQRRLTAMGAT